MKFIIEYTNDQEVGQNEHSVLWETWWTSGKNSNLEYAKDLLNSFRATPITPTARYRLCQFIVIEE